MERWWRNRPDSRYNHTDPAPGRAPAAHHRSRSPLARSDSHARERETIPVWWWWVGLALIALRTAVLIASVSPHAPLDADEPFYDELARNLMAGNGYLRHGVPSALRPPGWPIVLAALHLLFGDGRWGVVVFQGLCDAGTALLLAQLALRMFRDRSAAAFAFLLAWIWPPYFRESRMMQTEPLFTLLVTGMLSVFERAVRGPGRDWLLLGLFTALAAMVRPPALFLLGGLMLAWLALERPPRRRAITSLACTVAAIALVISPWAIRNALVFHAFLPFSLGTGDQLYQGTMLETEGRWNQELWIRARAEVLERERTRVGRPLTVFEADRAMTRAAIETVREHPGRSAVIAMKRLWRVLFTPVTTLDMVWLRIGFFVTLIGLYGLAVRAVMPAMGESDPLERLPAVIFGAWLMVMVLSSCFLTTSRYAEPFRTIPLLLAAGTMAHGWSLRLDRR